MENEKLNKWIEKELKRPSIQEKLRYIPENDVDIDDDDEISVTGTGKVSWINKDGETKDLFDININIKFK
ncbi:hypothetical protein A4G19_15515 [Pasteurellaceae bacterium Macca]|nr:hypothetical protein [Pasteurellaceae bacterium Macca]MCK3657068.1 hypothetical protein [Pasteurellaceae bacterium Macca]